MYTLKPCKEALKIYYDLYQDWFNFLNLDISYNEFVDFCSDFDIYGLYCNNELKGCIFFEPKDNGVVFHLAMLPEIRGKWSFYWPKIKEWMLDEYQVVFGVAHATDSANNRLLSRAGFKLLHIENNFNWWKLWR